MLSWPWAEYRLSLDGKSIIEDWINQAPRTRDVVMPLEAGRANDLVLEFHEHGGGAQLPATTSSWSALLPATCAGRLRSTCHPSEPWAAASLVAPQLP